MSTPDISGIHFSTITATVRKILSATAAACGGILSATSAFIHRTPRWYTLNDHLLRDIGKSHDDAEFAGLTARFGAGTIVCAGLSHMRFAVNRRGDADASLELRR